METMDIISIEDVFNAIKPNYEFTNGNHHKMDYFGYIPLKNKSRLVNCTCTIFETKVMCNCFIDDEDYSELLKNYIIDNKDKLIL